jgi:ADP-heptose:LPS heptosyltransferase
MNLELALDCRHYRGDRPCRSGLRCRCENYAPMGQRIAIIKLGSLGDVVRTACLLPTLKKQFPISHITWITRRNGARILAGHPQLERLVVLDAESSLVLSQESFDLVLSLDKEPPPAALCSALKSPDKRGMRLSAWGTVEPCNDDCREYFELGLDDQLKFQANHKSYPQLIHEAVGLPYIREPYRLYVDEKLLDEARQKIASWKTTLAGPIVGLNTGSGSTFANKAPSPRRWAQIGTLLAESGCGVLLLGEAEQAAANDWIAKRIGSAAFDTGGQLSERQFVAMVSQCDTVVTGDTPGLHVAVARRVPVVALFGPTCAQEIDLYGVGCKFISSAACGPCYRRHCDRRPSCMDEIDVQNVVAAGRRLCAVTADVRMAL